MEEISCSSRFRGSRRKHIRRRIGWLGRYGWIIIVGITVLVNHKSYSRQLEFVSEEVELIVGDSTCTVKGSYWFRNTGSFSVDQTLFYPFAVNELLPFPDTIVVVENRSGRLVNFIRGEQGVLFGVTVPAFCTALYQVSYTQRTPALSMRYILRTTSQWGKPLERALYRVCLPRQYVLTSSTIIFQTFFEEQETQVFEQCEENFLPAVDFAIQWKRRMP